MYIALLEMRGGVCRTENLWLNALNYSRTEDWCWNRKGFQWGQWQDRSICLFVSIDTQMELKVRWQQEENLNRIVNWRGCMIFSYEFNINLSKLALVLKSKWTTWSLMYLSVWWVKHFKICMGETSQNLWDFLSVVFSCLRETTCFLFLLWENLSDQEW